MDDTLTLAQALPDAIQAARTRLAELKAKVVDLEKLGLADATPFYRDGKYLYLVYPQQDGQRKREYIGADPAKVRAALARIARVKEHAHVRDQAANLEQTLNRIDRQLRNLHSELTTGEQRSFGW